MVYVVARVNYSCSLNYVITIHFCKCILSHIMVEIKSYCINTCIYHWILFIYDVSHCFYTRNIFLKILFQFLPSSYYACHFIREETYTSNITSFPALSVLLFTNVRILLLA